MKLLYLDTSDLRTVRCDADLRLHLERFLARHDARLYFSQAHLTEWLLGGAERAARDFEWWRASFPNSLLAPSAADVAYGYLRGARDYTAAHDFSVQPLSEILSIEEWQSKVQHYAADAWQMVMGTLTDTLTKGNWAQIDSLGALEQSVDPAHARLRKLSHDLMAEGAVDLTPAIVVRALCAFTGINNPEHPALRIFRQFLEDNAPVAFWTGSGGARTNQMSTPDTSPILQWFDALVDDQDQSDILALCPQSFIEEFERTGALPKEFLASHLIWKHLPIGVMLSARKRRLRNGAKAALSDRTDEQHLLFGLNSRWCTVDERTYEYLHQYLRTIKDVQYYCRVFKTGKVGLYELLAI